MRTYEKITKLCWSYDIGVSENVLCLLFPYDKAGFQSGRDKSKMQGRIISGDLAFGRDYHRHVGDMLRAITGRLLEEFPNNSFAPYCDTGPLNDKALAVKSGLAVYGRNGLALNEKYGTNFFIGYIITDLDLPDTEADSSKALCKDCNLCTKACPRNVDFGFDFNACISALTQKRGILAKEDMRALGNNLYGCHICQDVCPYNKGRKDFAAYVSLEECLSLSNKEFANEFKNTAAGWIGRNTFLRNALTAMGNSKKEEAESLLEGFLLHENDTLSTTAKRALEILREDTGR